MLKPGRFWLKNYNLWQAAEFYFEPGITHIAGVNRSGKTLLFRALGHILRAQALRRGSSLSSLPRGAQIGLDFVSGTTAWAARLTPTILNLQRDGADQGATGKRAPREMLTAALALPVELFDSTIHLQGTGDHPLIVGRPLQRLEWMSAVLDLTDAYDRAAVKIMQDLSSANFAAAQLTTLEQELAALGEPPPVPNLEKLEQQLRAARSAAKQANRGLGWLDALDALDALQVPEPSQRRCARTVHKTKQRLAQLRQQLQQAEAYHAETTRRSQITKLKKQLQHCSRDPITLPVLTVFTRTLQTTYEQIELEQQHWRQRADERRQLHRLTVQLAQAPRNLQQELENTRTSAALATRQIRHLTAVAAERCPVCSAYLSPARQARLLHRSRQLEQRSAVQLTKLLAWETARNRAAELTAELKSLRQPLAVDLTAQVSSYRRRVRLAQQRVRIKQRLRDLHTGAAVVATPVVIDLKQLHATIRQVERQLETAHGAAAAATRAAELQRRLRRTYGSTYAPQTVRQTARQTTAAVESLVVAVTAATAAQAEATRIQTTRQRLKRRIDRARHATRHLPELLALREAMGQRGLRLIKIRELCLAFQAEFNALIPLLWSDPFVLEIEVKSTGIELFAVRHGLRGDLFSLSGSEMKAWKLITALALIRLLPDRLRCDTIILDELEANMDPDTLERFVSEYLPTLGQHVPNVVLVSPLDYRNLPLTATRSFRVVRRGPNSSLEKVQ